MTAEPAPARAAAPASPEVPRPRATSPAASDARQRDPMELLIDVCQLVAKSLDLQETLQAVARAVVASLGFGAAVVNLVEPEGVVVAALEGPAEMKAALRGSVQSREAWQQLLDSSKPLGSLRFIDGREQPELEDVLSWVPELPIRPDEGAWHPLDALFAPLYGSDGQLIGVLSVDLPVDGKRPGAERIAFMERFARQAELATDRARMHRQLADSEELFRRSFEVTPLGMALVDTDGSLLRVNPAFASLSGASVGDLIGRSIYELGSDVTKIVVRRTLQSLIDGGTSELSGDVQIGERRWVRAHASRVDSRSGTRVLLHVEDVTDMHESREALRRRASTDALTGALNRDGLDRLLHRMAGRPGGPPSVAMLFVDLDLFKVVNDNHGHSAGDRMLRTIARRMRETLRSGDLLCRFGGDEFVVCLPAVTGPAHAVEVAERLLAVISEPLDVDGHQLNPSVSIGITVGSLGSHDDVERLLGEADSALYRAKAAGRARWELFSASGPVLGRPDGLWHLAGDAAHVVTETGGG